MAFKLQYFCVLAVHTMQMTNNFFVMYVCIYSAVTQHTRDVTGVLQ